MNFEKGVASISQYNASGPGTFGMNPQSSHCQAAIPYRFFTPSTTGAGGASGACPTGVSAAQQVMPTYKNEPLCYNLKNLTNGKTLKVQVTETCGGNCGPAGIDDCAVSFPKTMYESKNRAYPAQLCSPMPSESIVKWGAGKITGAGADKSATYSDPAGTCQQTPPGHIDWCSGLYAHFDISQDQSADFYSGCPGNDKGMCIGIAEYEKTPC